MANTNLTYDYIEAMINEVLQTQQYASPMGLFTNVAPVQWQSGMANELKIEQFVADNFLAEIDSKASTELPLLNGRFSGYRWEHVVVSAMLEHSIASEHIGGNKADKVQALISNFVTQSSALSDAYALSTKFTGLFGAQNVAGGNYKKVDETYDNPTNLKATIEAELDKFVATNPQQINILIGSNITKILKQSYVGARSLMAELRDYVAGGVSINIVENIIQYEAPAMLEATGTMATAILPNEVHFINPAKIKSYQGKQFESIVGPGLRPSMQQIEVSFGLDGLHAFDKNAIVKLSLTQA